MQLKIGILGTRGIPNRYGGFEKCAELLSAGLAQKGHKVWVYNSHNHPYQGKELNGAQIISCFDPEYFMGTAGQFIYDLNCILDARKREFDILLFLGYTSSSVWRRLYPRKSVIVYNMDGLEWKRSKYSRPVRYFLKYAEKLAVKGSDFLISDSVIIQNYLQQKYAMSSSYIPYGAESFSGTDAELLKDYSLSEHNYFMLMARMVPENSIELILEGFHNTDCDKKFIVLGTVENKFGHHVIERFKNDSRIVFLGGIFNAKKVSTLLHYSFLYFHGHSVGGTNPSLLEAMCNKAFIAAHDNSFNKSVLGNDAIYFSSSADVKNIVETVKREKIENPMIENNLKKIHDKYSWRKIVDQYETLFADAI
jgi:glycosyltransferase involved in cell wall biosynthesis